MPHRLITTAAPTAPLRAGARRVRRRGYTLVFLALLLAGLMALAALVIDLGLFRLTHRQLATAADAAALEGLRYRDHVPPPRAAEFGEGLSPEEFRRHAARNVVDRFFDNDGHLATVEPSGMGGAVMEFTGGIPLGEESRASELMSVPEDPWFHPSLDLNLANSPGGDLESSPDSTRFTARIRRGGPTPPPGATAGPQSPFLFTRGSLLLAGTRGGGINLRVESTAAPRPATRVGTPHGAANLPGGLPLAVRIDAWSADSVAAYEVVDDTGAGRAYRTGEMLAFLAPTAGFPDRAIAAAARLADDTPFGYAPLVDPQDRVVGFGWVELAIEEGELRLTPRSGLLAPENASAVGGSRPAQSTLPALLLAPALVE